MHTLVDLFAGIGGFSLGFEGIAEPVMIVEKCDTCREAAAKRHPDAVIKDDIRTTTAKDLDRTRVWIVCGGFPCQDISTAGRGAGLDGARSGLWWEMRRVIAELRPPWVLIENVPALRVRGSDDVLTSLEELGYTEWPCVVGVRHCGGTQNRDRIFIVAYLQEPRGGRLAKKGRRKNANADGRGEGVANTNRKPEHTRTSKLSARRALAQTAAVGSQSQITNSVNGGGMADSEGSRLEAERASVGASTPFARLTNHRWPMPPGEAQHDWEEPRLTYRMSSLKPRPDRLNPRWVEQLMGFPVGWTPGMWRHQLEALGNAVSPPVVSSFARAIERLHNLLEG